MNRIINKFRNPIIVTVLMVSIVLIPFISSPFTEVHAEDVYQAYTKSGEYPASDHLKNPIYVRPNGSNDKGDVAYCFNDHRSFPETLFHRERLYIQRNLEQLQSLKNLLILKELLEKIFIMD